MPGSFIESDLATLFAVGEFATAATWIDRYGDQTAINLILDEPEGQAFALSTTATPTALVRASDVPGIDAEDLILIGNTRRRVTSATPINDGLLIRLEIGTDMDEVSC